MKARAIAAEIARDLSLLGGIGAITYGAWLAYEPAGFVVAGVAAVLVSRGLTPGGPAHAG